MPTPTLDPAKRAEVLRLKQKGYSQKQIAEMSGVATGTVFNVINERENSKNENDRIDAYAGYHREKFLELKERFDKWIGDTDRAPKSKAPSKKSRNKGIVLNDLHTPFHNEDALSQVIRDNRDADRVIIPGDFMDLFSFSRYEKYSAPVSPVEEFQTGRAVLRTLAERYSEVLMMPGNHDDRFLKWLVRDKQIPPAILEFFTLQDPHFLSPLAKICSGFPNVRMMEAKKLDYAKFPFIHQLGDCVLSHAEKFSKIPNKAVGEVIHWLKSYAQPQGLVGDFKVVIQAHTHQAGSTWCDYDVLGIEAGCMAKVPDYSGDPKIRGAQRPSVVGYTLLYQDNGVTDRNETRFIRLN